MEAAFELLHMFLEHPQWDEEAFKRAKSHYLSSKEAIRKSLEKATAERIMQVGAVGRATRAFCALQTGGGGAALRRIDALPPLLL